MFVFMFRRFSFVLFVVSVFIMFSCENDPEIIYRDVIMEVPVEIPVEIPIDVPFEVPIEVFIEVPVVTYYEFDPKHPEDLPVGKTAYLAPYYSDESLSIDLTMYYFRDYHELIAQGFKSSYYDFQNEDYIEYDLGIVPLDYISDFSMILYKYFAGTYLTRLSEDIFIVSLHIFSSDTVELYKTMMLKRFITRTTYYKNK